MVLIIGKIIFSFVNRIKTKKTNIIFFYFLLLCFTYWNYLQKVNYKKEKSFYTTRKFLLQEHKSINNTMLPFSQELFPQFFQIPWLIVGINDIWEHFPNRLSTCNDRQKHRSCWSFKNRPKNSRFPIYSLHYSSRTSGSKILLVWKCYKNSSKDCQLYSSKFKEPS